MSPQGPGDREGLGTRRAVRTGAGSLETTLEVDPALVSAEGFFDAVARQRDVLKQFDHPQLASATAVGRRQDGGRLTCDVVSEHPPGERLGHLLDRCQESGVPLSTAAVLYLVRELIDVVRGLHAHRAGLFHGAITVDAVIITSDQRVVLRDQVFGHALTTVSLPADAWWRDHQIPVPATAGIPAFTPLTDQVQIGVLALSLLLGRRLDRAEYPSRLGTLLEMATETSIDGDEQPLGAALKAWMERTLLVSADGPFRSLGAAAQSLDELLDAEAGYVAAPIGLEVAPDVAGIDDVDAMASDESAFDMSSDGAYEVSGSDVLESDAGLFDTPAAAPRSRPLASYDPFALANAGSGAAGDDGAEADAADEGEDEDAERASHEDFSFIVESNDGSAAPLLAEGTKYEPIDRRVRGRVAPRGDGATTSAYDAEPDEATIQTNAAPPALVEAPRPFWDLPLGNAAPVRDPQPNAGHVALVSPGTAIPPVTEQPHTSNDGVPAPRMLRIAASGALPQGATAGNSEARFEAPQASSSHLLDAVAELERSPVRQDVTKAMAPAPPRAEPAAPAREPARAETHEVVVGKSALAAAVGQGEGRETGRRAAPSPAVPARVGPIVEAPQQADTLRRWLAIGAVIAVVTGGGLAAGYLYLWPKGSPAPAAAAAAEPGRMRLESKPAGALVRVNGVGKGSTPLTLAVPPGAYRLEFERGDESRSISVVVTSNNETYQSVMLYPPGPPGEVTVGSVPTGAAVSINGESKGRTPVHVEGLAPGEYTVVVENSAARVERKVEVLSEQVAAIDIPLSGLVEISSPIPLRVHDGDQPLGELRNGRLAVGAGMKRLSLSNYELGFEEVREIDVKAGRVTTLVVTPPNGVLNITADTTTDVYLDGRPIGLTPLTNLAIALGMHEVTFRHARWGEQNYTVLVGLTTPSRLHVVMQPKALTAQRRAAAPPRRRP